MAQHGSCCGKWVTISETGFGYMRDFDCLDYMKNATAEQRRNICQQLFDADRMCPEIAPYCEPFKDDLARNRARTRDGREFPQEPEPGLADTLLDIGSSIPVVDATADAIRDLRRDREAWERGKNILHTALDLAGLIPALGIVPDAVNTSIYAIEGDWTNATISAAAMVEGIGQGATLTRTGVKIERKTVEALREEGLSTAMKGERSGVAMSRSDEITREVADMFDELSVLDPRSTGTITTSVKPRINTSSSPSERLAVALEERTGQARPPDHDAHHIVAEGDPRAERAREILEENGIVVDSGINGIWLPKSRMEGTLSDAASSHAPIHTNEYYEHITRRLEEANQISQEAVEQALLDIYDILMGDPSALSY